MSREKRIPFEVSVDPFYSESNMKILKESIKQLEQGKVVVKTLDELKELENGENKK
jgi:DNA-damage-inducible protein J